MAASSNHAPSSSTDSTTSSSSSSSSPSQYFFLSDLQALDPTADELDPGSTSWVEPTVIDDDDLTFGGKSLSAWHEEEGRRLSGEADRDDRRGRERVRRQGQRG